MSFLKRSKTALETVNRRVLTSTNRLVKTVEQVIGIEEVRLAQDNVIQRESSFVKAQNDRRTKQKELIELQSKLKSAQNQLGKISRSDDRYLDLVTEEHGLLRQEKLLRGELELLEQTERSAFSQLSTALRFSHERERVHGERTKYFSVVGSIIGAMVGAVATGISGYLRVRELHTAVDASANQCLQLQEMVGKLEKEVSASSEKNNIFLDEFRQLVGINASAILLAGVGEDNPKTSNRITSTSDSNISVEITQTLFAINAKLESIQMVLGKLSHFSESNPRGAETSGVDNSIDASRMGGISNPPESFVDAIDFRLNERIKKHTQTVSLIGIISGAAVILSFIFSLR